MTHTEFLQVLDQLRQHPAYTGCPFETANDIERLTGNTEYNQALSQALLEDWIEESAE